MRKQHAKFLRALAHEHGPNLSGLIVACTHLVLKRQDRILHNQETIMSKLDELKAENGLLKSAVLTLITQDDTNTQALKDLIGKEGGATDEDLQAVIDDSKDTRAQIAAALGRDTLEGASPLPTPGTGDTPPAATDPAAPAGDSTETGTAGGELPPGSA